MSSRGASTGPAHVGRTAPHVIELVAGARPNFVKLAPVQAALDRHPALEPRILHTGQHYDADLSDTFFRDLEIPEPDVHLAVGSGTHGVQTARILERHEAHLMDTRPAAVVVFGDVNSTVACALAASKLHIPVAHVEAGLRSRDRTMPEEINRIVTDVLSDRHYVTEAEAVANLRSEGIPDDQVVLVGNTMIDTLHRHLDAARERGQAQRLGVAAGGAYGLVTMHRPANVDSPERLARMVGLFHELSAMLPIVFPVHPRTRRAAEVGSVALDRADLPGWLPVGPQRYVDHLSLIAGATVVLTDSGGMQEECAFLGVPCIVLRGNTERPSTVDAGACRLVDGDVEAARSHVRAALDGHWTAMTPVPLWDGRAGERIADDLAQWLDPA